MQINNKSLKEQAEELTKIPGEIKGEAFNSFIFYIRRREGEKGLDRVLEKIRNMGFSFDYKAIEPLQFYPESLRVILAITAKEILEWTEEDVFEMGNLAPRRSFIIKVLLRYLVSVEKLYEKAPFYWGKHYNFGELKKIDFNKNEKYVIVRVIGYNFHPVMCIVFAGFFKGMTEFCVKGGRVKSEEVKCMHNGHPYHEYRITW